MASRKKNDPTAPDAPVKNNPASTTKAKKPAAKKPASSAKTVAAPTKRTPKPKPTQSRAEAALEELQAVGGDVVPTVTIEAETDPLSGASSVLQEPDAHISEAGPIIAAPTPNNIVDPDAIREHTIDQISPVANDRPES